MKNSNHQHHRPHFSRVFFGTIFVLVACVIAVYGAINYTEYFPNGSTIYQSQGSGWTTAAASVQKDIMTPEGCMRVTSTDTTIRFIPTRSSTEWNTFKTGAASKSYVNCPVDGVCTGSPYSCSAGNSINNATTGYSGYSTWNCAGIYSGTTSNCSVYNGCHPNTGLACNAGSAVWTADAQYQFMATWGSVDAYGQTWNGYHNVFFYSCTGTNPTDWCTVWIDAGPAQGTTNCDGSCSAPNYILQYFALDRYGNPQSSPIRW